MPITDSGNWKSVEKDKARQGSGLYAVSQTVVYILSPSNILASQLKSVVKLQVSKLKVRICPFFQWSAEAAVGQKLVETQGFLTDYHRLFREAPFWTVSMNNCIINTILYTFTGETLGEQKWDKLTYVPNQTILGYHRLLSVMKWLWTPWKSENHSKQWIKPRVKKLPSACRQISNGKRG